MAKLMFTFSHAHHELSWCGSHRNVSHHNLTTAFHLILFPSSCAYKPYQFFKRLNVPGPKPLPFIGTLHHLRKHKVLSSVLIHQHYAQHQFCIVCPFSVFV